MTRKIILIFIICLTYFDNQAQLYKVPTFQINESDGIYCSNDSKFLAPMVQAIQDKLDLYKYGKQLDSTILYKSLEAITTNDLTYTVYTLINSNAKLKPMFIFAHGGAFVTGSRKSKSIKFLAIELAKKGFMAASIDYRHYLIKTWDLLEASYITMQDGNPAIKFFKANENRFGIDSSRVFISGISAGATLSLHCGRVDRSDTGLKTFEGFDQKYGRYNCTGNNFNISNNIRGVINIVGRTTDPNIIDSELPTLHIYCAQDSVLPANSGIPLLNASAISGVFLKSLIGKILPMLNRPEVFGPEYLKNNLTLIEHSFIEISSMMGESCTHSVIISDDGTPKASGIKKLEETYIWLTGRLGPRLHNKLNYNLSLNNWSGYRLLDPSHDEIKSIVMSSTNFQYRLCENNAVELFTSTPGQYTVTVTAINDLGLQNLKTYSFSSSSNADTNSKNKFYSFKKFKLYSGLTYNNFDYWNYLLSRIKIEIGGKFYLLN